jgi:hypothetical protein
VLVRSVNGLALTIIEGGLEYDEETGEELAVRCAHLGA